jgi:hypothetical protein
VDVWTRSRGNDHRWARLIGHCGLGGYGPVAFRPENPDLSNVVLSARSAQTRSAADVDVGISGAVPDRGDQIVAVVRWEELSRQHVATDAVPDL